MDYNTGDIIIMDNEAKEDKNINKDNDQFSDVIKNEVIFRIFNF